MEFPNKYNLKKKKTEKWGKKAKITTSYFCPPDKWVRNSLLSSLVEKDNMQYRITYTFFYLGHVGDYCVCVCVYIYIYIYI